MDDLLNILPISSKTLSIKPVPPKAMVSVKWRRVWANELFSFSVNTIVRRSLEPFVSALVNSTNQVFLPLLVLAP